MLRTTVSAAMLLALLSCTVGCQSPYYGSPYGYGPPGMYAPPAYQGQPGGVPQGAYIPPNANIGSINGIESNAPTWDSGTTTAPSPIQGNGTSNSGQGGVPDYDDPTANPDAFPFDQSSSYSPPANSNGTVSVAGNATFAPPELASPEITAEAEPIVSIQQTGGNNSEAVASTDDEAFPGNFFEPVEVADTNTATSVMEASSVSVEETADPFANPDSFFQPEETAEASNTSSLFAYDGEKFSWIQGVVQFNPQDGSWRVQYSNRPDKGDLYGGVITLAKDERLKSLKPGDYVIVEGSPDVKTKDLAGKPLYIISNIAKLEQDQPTLK